jgi:cyclase
MNVIPYNPPPRRVSVRRLVVLTGLVVLGAVSMVVGQSQQPATYVLEVEKVRDNLFILKGTGSGGNTAVFVGSSGVAVVDTKIRGWGPAILAKIKELTPTPITTIINTHTHYDHVGTNPDFPANVDIVVHENTKANMEAMRPVTGRTVEQTYLDVFKDSKGKGLAKRSFKDKMTIGSGADQIDLYYFGRGHTNGDAWVVFPALRVMHAGDIFSGKNLPLLDANNGGSGVAIGDTLAKAASAVKNVDSIITGHSTVMTMKDLAEYAEFNRDFLAAVQAGKKAGKSIDDIAAGWKTPAKYVGYAAPAADRLKSNVEVIYNEIK